jgi:predicted DsbA family dithiol-disulfide isomerase
MEVVLYTDLNCPFCYATEQRLGALGAHDRVEWRGVEHEPDLPVPMLTDDEELSEELADEVAQVRSRAPEVEIAQPAGKSNTAHALEFAAAAERLDPVRGREVRHAIYRSFWAEGRDISRPEVLVEIGREHGLPDVEVRPEDKMRVTSWRLDWERSPLRGVPLLVRSDGEVLYGLKDVETLASFVGADWAEAPRA